MIKFRYSLYDFDSSTGFSDGNYEIHITLPEIIHAALTIGRKSWDDVFYHKFQSVQELLFRFYMVEAFTQNIGEEIGISEAYNTLDPSEKGAINYFNGGVFTNLIAKRIFDTHWLQHLDVYKRNLYNSKKMKITKSADKRSRPDFIGRNIFNQYNVFESKARVSYTNKVLNKAYQQAKNIKTINDQPPRLKLGCVLSHNNSTFKMRVKDPIKSNYNAYHLKLNEIEFFKNYYAFIFNFIEQNSSHVVLINNIKFIMTKMDCHNFSIGLQKDLFNALKSDIGNKLLGEMYNGVINSSKYKDNVEQKSLKHKQKDQFYIGRDGVIVKVYY